MSDPPQAGKLLAILVLLGLILLPAGFMLISPTQQRIAENDAQDAVETGDYQRAASELLDASAFSTNPEVYWERIGFLYFEANDPAAAIHYFEKARAATLLSMEGLTALGDSLAQLGELSSAVSAWERAAAVGEASPDLLRSLFQAHLNLGNNEVAVNYLSRLVTVEPRDIEAQLQLGLLLAALDPEEAIPVLNQLEELAPAKADLYRELALEIRRSRAVSSQPEFINLAAGRALASAGAWDMAALAFEKAVVANPSYAEAWAYLGTAEDELGGSGAESLARAYALNSESLAVNLLRALHLQKRGNFDEAFLHLERARDANPENPNLVAEMASVVASKGDISAALELFQEAIQIAPEDPQFLKILAGFSIQNEVQVEEIGLPAARAATLIAQDDPEAYDLLGQAYLAVGNPLLAERFLSDAASLDPDYPAAPFHLGILYLTIGSDAQARQQLERVLLLAPETALADQAHTLISDFLQ